MAIREAGAMSRKSGAVGSENIPSYCASTAVCEHKGQLVERMGKTIISASVREPPVTSGH